MSTPQWCRKGGEGQDLRRELWRRVLPMLYQTRSCRGSELRLVRSLSSHAVAGMSAHEQATTSETDGKLTLLLRINAVIPILPHIVHFPSASDRQ